MSATDVIVSALEHNWDMVDKALEDLDDATLARQPAEDCNSIAWLLWHMYRVVDTIIHAPRSKPQIWNEEGWQDKFGMSEDEGRFGYGWSAERVGAWEAPPRDILFGYAQAVQSRTRDYIGNLGSSDLELTWAPPSGQPRTVSSSLSLLVYDNIAHGGQMRTYEDFTRAWVVGALTPNASESP